MKPPISIQDYWEKNLDIQNLGNFCDINKFDIERETAFWLTPDQQWVYEQLGSVINKLVIDIGGGLSVNCIILARRGATVVVADLSLPRLQLLKKILIQLGLGENVLLVCASAEALPFRSSSFDAVMTKSVLIHTDLPVAIAEIHRILKRAALALLVEPTTKNPLVNFYRRYFAPKEWQYITHYFSENSISTIRQALPELAIKPFYFLSFLAFFWHFVLPQKFLFKLSIKIFSIVDNLLFSFLPSLSSSCWFVAIKARK
ncbi:MAG: class I SAM-dependent methyltransferase [Candidatus Sumerlaeia bacterium]|nr:class I SAM-dependent methyltransferase [Candidatus Sumerlaeia bacterium]